ncbi:heat shock protein 30 [Coccidioides immitis RS]|uniref:Heat shock protein 30 n=7 Tax=Coccidioides TaxID=5500 RepID=J3KJV0_COCIM|nr:heat shock protein 30 [Coccidioides immitis RS]EFW13407.1 heat shock protein 30 [Coccidioides posadasii str. Silveira]KMM64715.1 hsp30-like protein [Coccidioides posadasii RMSCC 3488]KMP01750.1 30 kDa heat shock protein [Coccidioides immitis RMSCC 2394]KMU76267.1 heat shock protein [Coccidioides immitis RMSCC 3703]KMU88052.1 30 kDa heat shock protein [Coccidioides immitis H538.4]TPX25474.1 hypothetical protein DIZ76_010929 [Coccidioides immitis]
MALFPRGPHSEFGTLFRLLDDYDAHRADRSSGALSFAPKFDVRESKEAYMLDGELPGIDQKDINIEFSDPHTLVIHGRTERSYTSGTPPGKASEAAKGKETETGERYWVSERSVGEFQRSFNFPTRVDQDAVKANLRHGVLSIVVPKATAPQTKKITIQSA